MKVRVGTRSENGRMIEVEIEEDDLGPSAAKLTLQKKFDLMSKTGDILVVNYLEKAELITHDFAALRRAEIRGE